MQSLDLLNVSHNNLSSFILATFEMMHRLYFVNISYNELEGPLPNSTAFQEAHIEALQGNKRLCGNVTGLQPCKARHILEKEHKIIFFIIFPLLGTLSLVLVFFGIFFFAKRKWQNPHTNRTNNMDKKEVFAISSFDGRAMYQKIINTTQNFDANFCIGKVGYGAVYKAQLISGNIVAVKKLQSLHDGEIAQQKEFLNEVRALTKLHRNIFKFHGFCSHHNTCF